MICSFVCLLFLLPVACMQKDNRISRNKIRSDGLTYKSKYFLEKNMLDSAQVCIDMALKEDSTNFTAYNNRAILKKRQNKPHYEVISDFKKALQLNPMYELS